MRLTPAQASQLAHLAAGASLPRSQIPRGILTTLQRGHAVRLERSGAGYLVRGIPERLADFAQSEWGIRDLKCHAAATPDNRGRAMMAEIVGDSKALPNKPLQGIFLRCLGNVSLHGQALPSTPVGCSVFITPAGLPHLEIEASAIVGIENPACLFHFEKCRSHFPDLPGSIVLVLRWSWGAAWKDWLREWKSEFYYFPDYDPAGLRIFEYEVLGNYPKASLLIPSNLESLLRQRGHQKLFVTQERLLPMAHAHRQIDLVANLLRKTRRGLEQEHLLY
jgi:hypothetical protein